MPNTTIKIPTYIRFNEYLKLKSSRKLKIHTKFRRRTWDHTTVLEIRLEGKWLEELGFEQGKTVKVIQENKVLIVILED